MLLGAVAVAAHQVLELVHVGVDVPVDVHREEARELQEARIDPARHAPARPGHHGDDVVLEPAERPLVGQLVRLLRVACRVHRRAHQHHRGRPARVAGRPPSAPPPPSPGSPAGRPPSPRSARRPATGARSSRSGSRYSRRGRSSPSRHRHVAGVAPVGDVDVVVRQHVADGAAQQRRIVPRHRRDHQHLGVVPLRHGRRSRGGSAAGCRRAPPRPPPPPPGPRRRPPTSRRCRRPAARSAGWR